MPNKNQNEINVINNRAEIIRHFYNTFDYYGINDNHLKISKAELIEKSLTLMDSFGINAASLINNYEKILVLIAIIEDWHERIDESLGRLGTIFKMLTVEEHGFGFHGTYTERIKALYEKEFIHHETNCDTKLAALNYIRERYINSHIDKYQTWKANRFISSWHVSSPLADIRKRLSLNKNTERSIRVLVSSVGDEMIRELGTPQFVFYSPDKNLKAPQPFIVLGYGLKKVKSDPIVKGFLEHEYAHTQSGEHGEGFTLGLGGMLFEGLNEAVTDSLTTIPMNYKHQREVLELLFRYNEAIPLKNLLYSAYMGDKEARKHFLINVLRIYKLRGISMLARMTFKTNILHYFQTSRLTDPIFITPRKILEYFESIHNPKEALTWI
jgi:hypothetical protein